MLISPKGPGGLLGTTVNVSLQPPSNQAAGRNASANVSAPAEMPPFVVQSPPPPTTEQIKDALDRLNVALKTMSNDVQFTLDDETRIRVAKLVDSKTKEVIRQFPAQELIDLAKALDKLRGSLIQQKA